MAFQLGTPTPQTFNPFLPSSFEDPTTIDPLTGFPRGLPSSTSQAPPSLASLLTSSPQPGDPIVSRLPSSIGAYGNLDAYLESLKGHYSPAVIKSLRDLALQRIARGQAPPSTKQAADLLNAGTTLESQTPVPERGTGLIDILENAGSDVKDIFTSIPKLPALLYQQIQQLPQAPKMLSEALSKGDYKAAARTPGLNLIPGVYTLGNILSGDFGELARHPVMSALDVLPAAEAKVFAPADEATLAARASIPKLGRLLNLPESEYMQLAKSETGRATLQEMAARQRQFVGPQPRSLIQVIGDETPLGRIKDSIGQRLAATAPATFIRRGVGQTARNASNVSTLMQSEIHDVLNPKSILHDLGSPNNILNRHSHVFYNDIPAIQGLFDLERKYATPEGIAEMSGGKYTTIEQWEPRRQAISDAIQHNSLADVTKSMELEPFEVQMVHDARDLSERIAAPYTADHALNAKPTDSFAWVEFPHGRELYPIKQATKIENARVHLANHEQAVNAVNLPAGEAFSDPSFARYLIDTHVPLEDRARVLREELWKIRDSDPASAHAILSQFSSSLPVIPHDIAAVMAEEAKIPADLYTLKDIRDTYTKYDINGRRYDITPPPELHAFDQLMQNGHYSQAWKFLNKFFLKTKRVDALPEALRALDPQLLRESLYRNMERDKNLAVLNYRAKVVRGARGALTRIEKGAIPARFFPRVRDVAMSNMVTFAEELGHALSPDTPELAQQLADHVRNDQLSLLDQHIRAAHEAGITRADLGSTYATAREGTPLPPSVHEVFDDLAHNAGQQWREWANTGFDPTFIHAVDPEKGMNMGRITPRPTTVSNAKERTFSFAPLSNDLVVGLSHQMTEWLIKKQTDNFINLLADGSAEYGYAPFAATYEELERNFLPVAQQRAARYGTTPGEEARKLIDSQFAKFEPNQYLNSPRPGTTADTQALYMDKAILGTIQDMVKPAKISVMADPVMGVFRTSVLTLSPRWQIYNLLGNALQATTEHGFSWLKHYSEARDAIKYLSEKEHTGPPPAVMGRISDSMRLALNQAPRELAEFQYRTGQALALAFKGEPPGMLGKAVQGFDKFTSSLVKMNGVVDDMTRLMVYLDEFDRISANPAQRALLDSIGAEVHGAGGKQLSRVGVQNQAEAMVRKMMYSWDSMTPFERQTMRFVFPFYGFMSHIARFAYRYAVDHPVRMAFTSSFARNEMEDWKSGLPERLRSMILVNRDGKTTGINLAGWNPFGDVANTMSLTGWLSQVNPIFSTIAEQFGLDPRTGQANLYPSSQYDPVTGRLTLKTRDPVTAFMENLIPQTQLLDASGNIADLKRTDPAAAQRLELSAVGIPALWRGVDLPGEAMRAEGARQNAYHQALSDALKHPDRPSPYPVINQFRDQILNLQRTNPTALRQYTPARIADIQAGILTKVGVDQ